MKKRIAALGMALCMVISSMSLSAFAKESENDIAPPQSQQFEVQADTEDTESVRLLSASDTQRSILFNDDWKFLLGDPANASTVSFDDASWRKLTLPHDWSIEFDFNYKSAATSECGYLDGGTGWYRKSFILPESMKGKSVSIDFGGIYMNSTTYVNGTLIGNYPNGYMPFTYDITNNLICDGKTENVIAVKVVNQLQSSRWYSGSGIYRDVHLTVTDKVHVPNWGTKILTPDIKNGKGTVDITTQVENDSAAEKTVKVRQTVLNAEMTAVTEPALSADIKIAAGQTASTAQKTEVASPALWSNKTPNLYYLRTEILENGSVIDTYDSRFGFRYFEFTTDNGFYLNGQWTKLYGVCMHHDQGSLGAVANEAAIRRQMQIMKDMGVNAIRVTHNPADDKLLKICDELGLMVIEEAFDTWSDGKKTYDYGRFFNSASTHPDASKNMTWAEFDLKNMVNRGKNFPSVIMWSIGNEIYMTTGSNGVTTAQNLVKWIKEVDTTRPTTIGEDKYRGDKNDTSSNLGNASMSAIFDTVDVPGLNYSENRYDAQHKEKPNWKLYGSEIASATSSRGVYAHPDQVNGGAGINYQQSSYDTDCVGWGRTAMDSLVRDRDRKFIAGEFVWTGFDYIGEPTPWNQSTTTPPKSSYFGIVDTAGLPKDSYYLYQSQWTSVEENPMVHVLPHWNWEDADLLSKVKDSSGKIPIRVYTNARSVELYFKPVSETGSGIGTLVDTKKSFEVVTPYKNVAEVKDNKNKEYQQTADGKLYLEWRMAYQPGTLTAVAYDKNGTEIARDVITSASSSAAVSLKPETNVITADGSDICYVEVDIKDASGSIVPTADDEVVFNVNGNGRIVGVDNGDAASHERYKDTNGVWKRKAFNGKAMVLVQSTKEAGSFTLSASSNGLSSDAVTIYTSAAGTDGDTILGYNAKPVTTVINEKLQLPSKIEAVYADGTKKELSVTWDKISDDLLSKEGSFKAKGTLENKDVVELTVNVIGVSGVKNVTSATPLGTIPALPENVVLIFSNGTKKSTPVTWKPITAEQVSKVGSFEVEGTLPEYSTLKAKAIIRVSDEFDFSKVISVRASGTSYPKPSASYNGQDTNADNFCFNINDGIVGSGGRPGWNNWANGNGDAKTSWVMLQFEKSELMGKIGIHFFTDGQTRKPARIVVETSTDGISFTPVSNQSHIEDFGDADNDSSTEFPITFDPVSAKYIRVSMDGQPNGSNFKPVGISELYVYSKSDSVVVGQSAALDDLKLDGKSIDGFAKDKYDYTVALSYPYELPKITASASDHADIFIINAVDPEGAATVIVTSESGTVQNTYTIRFEKNPLKLKNAALQTDKTTLKENESAAVTLNAYLEDGTFLDQSLASVEYTVTSTNGGQANLSRNILNAIAAGTVTIQAKVTYQGVTVDTPPLNITIEKNSGTIDVASYAEVNVVTKPGIAPVLPETVVAHVNDSFDRTLPVTWDAVNPAVYANYGTFKVYGTVTGQTLRPYAVINVKDIVSVDHVTAVTPVNVIPQLPENTTAYFSDGTSISEAPVIWDEMTQEQFDQADGFIVTVNGVVNIDGYTASCTASIRITSTDVEKSENYYALRNGYELPFAVASFTNDGADSTDRIHKLNDGTISFAQSDDAGKNVWCNWVRNTARTSDWAGVIMAKEGKVMERYPDTLSVGFFKETNASGIQYPSSYKVEYYTGPLDFELPDSSAAANPRGHISEISGHPFNNTENWKEVTYTDADGKITNTPPVPLNEQMTDITFLPVKTCIVRVNMTTATNNAFGITEIQAYGKTAKTKDSYEVTSIKAGNTTIENFNESTESYTLNLTDYTIPEITAEATNHASVTVIPATAANPTASIIVFAENRMPETKKVYTIHMKAPDNTAEFEALIQTVKSIDKADYTKASYDVLADTLEDALALDKNANAFQKKAMILALQSARDALVPVSDKTVLKAAIDAANNLLKQASLYTPDSILHLPAMIAEANKLFLDDSSSQNAINTMTASLKAETSKAMRRADKAALTTLVNILKNKNLSTYTTASVTAFKNALTNAQNVLANPNISIKEQQTVTNAYNSLSLANSKLLPALKVPGKVTGLKISVSTTSSFKASWNKVSGTASYKVMIYDAGSRKWSTYKTVSGTSLKITKRKAGGRYAIKVAAINKAGSGSYSSTVKTAVQPLKASATVKKYSSNSIRFTIKKRNCTGYQLYERKKSGKYKLITKTTKTKLVLKKIKKSSTHNYKLRAYTSYGSKTAYGSFSKPIKITMK